LQPVVYRRNFIMVCLRQLIAQRSVVSTSSLIAFGRAHNLPCCRLSTAFETATRAYHQLANGTESENGIDRQTDGRKDRSIALCPTVGRGGIRNGTYTRSLSIMRVDPAASHSERRAVSRFVTAERVSGRCRYRGRRRRFRRVRESVAEWTGRLL